MVRLRRAVPGDYARAGAVTEAAYSPFTRGEDDPYVAKLRDAATRDREAELWVATAVEDDDDLLGCVTLCPPGSRWRELAGDDEGEFRMLAVAPHAQRRGVGEALVRLCLERFWREGSAGVVISSLEQMTAAHRLYDRLGFRRLPDRDWEPLPGVRLIAFRTDLDRAR